MTNEELTLKIKELREMQRLIEEAEAEAEHLKDEIKAHMGSTEELSVGEYKVTYKTVCSNRIDTATLKKRLPDIAAAFTKQTSTRRFCIA